MSTLGEAFGINPWKFKGIDQEFRWWIDMRDGRIRYREIQLRQDSFEIPKNSGNSGKFDMRLRELFRAVATRIVPVALLTLSVIGIDTCLAQEVTKPADKTESGADKTESAEEEQLYVRLTKNRRNLVQELQTSIVTLKNSKKYPGTQVDLVGAIHLGEPAYYTALNEKFKEYDVVLFEAVMPEEAVRKDWRPGASGSGRPAISDEEEWTEAKVGLAAISVVQLGMKDALGFEFQLGAVDYSPKNFVHADMTAEEFEESMARRGETFSKMMAREMSKSMIEQQKQNPLAMNLDMMVSALASDRLYRVRRIAAAQLAKAGEGDAFAGYDGTSTIITERNIKCLDILKKQLTAESKPKKIAVFYGAGHLNDMEKRLTHLFGYERTGEEWLTAWNLRPPELK
ncbi:MAG: hypothetical protein JNL58_11240 [Planctomyces sp.]|nr:hypothetical protein [Planctomyces sp.]